MAEASSIFATVPEWLRCKLALTVRPRSLSPRAWRGWGEGASPLGTELRRSESLRGPLTLVRYALSTSPRAAGRGDIGSRSRGAFAPEFWN
jgi:hypothetical protein